MSANQLLITQENANGEFAIKVLTPVAGQVIGFDAGLSPVPLPMPTGSSTPTINTSLTSLAIDCSVADIFRIPISANANFVISNASGEKVFRVKNTSASAITVTMPNGQIYSNQFVDISAGKARIFKLSFYGSQYEWLVSGELANV